MIELVMQQEKIKLTLVKCICGKLVEEYYTEELIGGELVMILHNYPETHCHCKVCGKKFGEHFK